MPLASEIDLAFVPIEDQALADDPIPFFEAARRQHPWLARCSVGYIITDYQAMKDILGRDDELRMPSDQIVELMGAKGTGWGHFTEEMLLSKHGAEHDRVRASVGEAFTPRAVNRLRGMMREVVSDLLDEWTPKGAFDFADFAANFPIRVMFGLIGADPKSLPSIRSSLEMQGSSFGLNPAMMPEIEEAYQILWRFVDGIIIERGPNDARDDLLNDMIRANTSGALSDVELRQMLIFLFGAGYDTSKNLLTLIMFAMIKDPEKWKRCAGDRAYCDGVIEEALRHTSPSNPYRMVTEPFEYCGVNFPQGAMLIFPLSISGRDDKAFPNAAAFEPEREHINRPIAFGRGMHICLGQFLARAQLEEGVHIIAQRITNPQLDGEIAWRPFPGVWGLKTLPIRLDAEALQ